MFAVLLLVAGADPAFEVVNKCPPVKFTVVNKMPAAPVVAAKKAFRGDNFHAGHQCPECGRTQYVISGWLPNGQHRHVCSAGHSWIH